VLYKFITVNAWSVQLWIRLVYVITQQLNKTTHTSVQYLKKQISGRRAITTLNTELRFDFKQKTIFNTYESQGSITSTRMSTIWHTP